MIVKVVVNAVNNPNKEYELNRDQPLRSHVASLCGLFNISANVPEYTLQFNTSGVYISEEVGINICCVGYVTCFIRVSTLFLVLFLLYFLFNLVPGYI